MSLKNIHKKLETLAKTSSTLEKVELLKEYLKDPIFKRIVWCTYTPTLNYKIKQFPKFKPYGFIDKGWKYILPILKEFSSKPGVTNSDKERLVAASSIDPETLDVVNRICNKDLRCGIGRQLINEALPGTIKGCPYQRCRTSKHIDGIRFDPEAIAQTKADGAFVNTLVSKTGKIKFVARSGETVNQLDHLIRNLKSQPPKRQYAQKGGLLHLSESEKGLILDRSYLGELRVFERDMKTIMSRKKGNGIITQCIRGTADENDAKRVFLTVWDSIPLQDFWKEICTTAYQTRLFSAISFVNSVDNNKYLRLIRSKRVKSLEEAYAFYREERNKGEEGAIIKNVDAIWKDQQSGSPDMIKLKHSFDFELEVIGWEKGKKGKKNEDKMGAIICKTSCGKLITKIGYGFTDEEREWDWDMLIGSIISGEAESISIAKNKSKYALYSASFIEVREDKNKANSLEELIEIEKESKKSRRSK